MKKAVGMNELELSAILGLFIEFSEDFQRQKFKMESEDGPPSLTWIFSPSECMLKTSNTILKFLELPVQNATVRDVKVGIAPFAIPRLGRLQL